MVVTGVALGCERGASRHLRRSTVTSRKLAMWALVIVLGGVVEGVGSRLFGPELRLLLSEDVDLALEVFVFAL